MNRYYFTFGSDPKYPYGIGEYVLVKAETIQQAANLFKAVHPSQVSGELLCAWVYNEAHFDKMKQEFYPNRDPAETISVKRRSDA